MRGFQDNVHPVIQPAFHGGGLLPAALCPPVGVIAVVGLREKGILSVFIGEIDTGLSVFSCFAYRKRRDIDVGAGITVILHVYTLAGDSLIFVCPDCDRYFVYKVFADIFIF